MGNSIATVRVICDDRELRSKVPYWLKRLGVRVIIKRLDVGDYVIAENVVVERKNIRDFINSIYDGRLFDQTRRLVEVYDKSIIIVEGDLSLIEILLDKPQVFYGAIASLILKWNIPVLYTCNEQHTAILISRIAYQLGEKARKPIALRRKRKLETVKDWQLFIVESLPGVGPTLARRLLEHFGNVRRIFNASSIELQRVPGMTESKAREIFRILNAPYESHEKVRHKQVTLEEFQGN